MGFETLAGFSFSAHVTLYVPPTCHTVAAVGSRIPGTQASLTASCVGAARIVEEAEKRRAAKVVANIIMVGGFRFARGFGCEGGKRKCSRIP
jgi:hypothetical protein